VELTGRTDEGEVTEEMTMFWGGVVDWTDEAKTRIAEATREIVRRLEVDEETANRLLEGMADVYEAMATKGLCAYPGGDQSVRVIPEALEFIRRRENAVHDD
jgi:nicotinamide mononucleotide (NMN) deamidase PncC